MKSQIYLTAVCAHDNYGHAENPHSDAIILDGAAIINMLKPGPGKTFYEYALMLFIPYKVSLNMLPISMWCGMYMFSTHD